MLSLLALVLCVSVDPPQTPVPAIHITRTEHEAVLKESIAKGTVDQPIKASDVLGGKASVAMLHRVKPEASALIHDDVMDGSERRRGAPTVHVAYADEHERHEWRGEPRRFGDGVAILVGDLTSVMADELLAGAPPDAVAIWNRLRLEVNIGQYLDVLGAADGTFDLERARRVARYKSGKYTVERPLHLGAALAGGLAELAEPLGRTLTE